MKISNIRFILIPTFFLFLLSCQSETTSPFKDVLTFYASFDNGTTADFALGDKNMYTAESRKQLDKMQAGMNNAHHRIIEGGQNGSAFEFGEKGDTVVFYKSKDNVAYDSQNWSGTISFWLSVDPSSDLAGYTDPIQITDVSYNDASIWVDYTDKEPRDFRLGVLGDKDIWIQDTLEAPMKDVFDRRVVSTPAALFSRSTWTHVLISYDGLGTANSVASLYLNGDKIGSISGIDDPFTWDLDKSNIFLGLNFTGSMDELSIFNKSFTDAEAKELFSLKGGIKSIL